MRESKFPFIKLTSKIFQCHLLNNLASLPMIWNTTFIITNSMLFGPTCDLSILFYWFIHLCTSTSVIWNTDYVLTSGKVESSHFSSFQLCSPVYFFTWNLESYNWFKIYTSAFFWESIKLKQWLRRDWHCTLILNLPLCCEFHLFESSCCLFQL